MSRIFAVCFLALTTFANTALAEALIWQLPEDGTWVRYEGTYQQTELRPDDVKGNLEIEPWIEQVSIKSVGQQTAEYKGERLPCRWLEFRIERGRESDGKLDAGAAGLEIYKVLVPETAIIPDNKDGSDVPVAYLPVIKGFRKMGDDAAVPLKEPALQLYPLGLMTGYFRSPTLQQSGVTVETGLGEYVADVWEGKVTTERPSSRTIQESSTWRSDSVPFGVARWTSKLTRETKDERAARDAFIARNEVLVEMKLVATGTDATSEIDAK